MEFYLARRNESFSFAGKWVELENIILSKVSLVQEAKMWVTLRSPKASWKRTESL
jgi:hypothetical protein